MQALPLPKNKNRIEALNLLKVLIEAGFEPTLIDNPDNTHYDLTYLEQLGYGYWLVESFKYVGPGKINIQKQDKN